MISKTQRVDVTMGGTWYQDVKRLNITHEGFVQFEHTEPGNNLVRTYKTNAPTIIVTSESLSCGHHPADYYEQDNGNAPYTNHCRTCESFENITP